MKKVSVIIPCHNDGRYLPDALASVEAQTYPDVEIILSDDGSTDEATLACLRQAEAEGRARVVYSQTAQGPSAARNKAIRLAEGEYILPLDADDRLDPVYIEKTVAMMEQHPEAAVVYPHGEYFDEVNGAMQLADYSLCAMLVDNVVFVTALIRRNAAEQVGLFDEAFRTGLEDYDLFLSLLEAGWEIVQLPEVLFYCRVKPVSRTSKMVDDNEKFRETYAMIYRKHRALYVKNIDLVIPAMKEAFVAQRSLVTEKQREIFRVQNELNRYASIPRTVKQLFRLIAKKFVGR